MGTAGMKSATAPGRASTRTATIVSGSRSAVVRTCPGEAPDPHPAATTATEERTSLAQHFHPFTVSPSNPGGPVTPRQSLSSHPKDAKGVQATTAIVSVPPSSQGHWHATLAPEHGQGGAQGGFAPIAGEGR